MYLNYFGLVERPFSIAPDPQYLYMSARHREAMAHLSYGLSQGGCFIVLTGEVGTGKTTLCRNLLADLPDNVDVALILNPKINRRELLETVCDELKIDRSVENSNKSSSKKQLLDSINDYLLNTYAQNRHTVLIIDEAQLLSRTVLEQVRLLTNLETTKSKLLQIILIGQPELNDLLARNDLRQLAQRVTARYHLPAISKEEIQDYVNFRLSVAGCKKPLFSAQSLKLLHQLSEGIPRKINVLADHALLATYAKSELLVDSKTLKASAKDVFVTPVSSAWKPTWLKPQWALLGAGIVLLNLALWWVFADSRQLKDHNVVATEVHNDSSVDRNDLTSEPPKSKPVVSQSETVDIVKTDSEAATVTEPLLTTIIKSDDIIPGSVVISEQYLDDEPGVLIEDGQVVLADEINTTANTPTGNIEPVTPPAYLAISAFGRVLEVSPDRTGRVEAFRNLAAAWDVELPSRLLGPLCDELSAQGVACLAASNWGAILRYNRPTIMVLSHRGKEHRVILYKLVDGVASVLVGDQSYELPVSELRDRWADNAVVFWRPSEIGGQLVQQGDEVIVLPQLRKKLNQVFTSIEIEPLSDSESALFDSELADKVNQLQRRFGIVADGKVGSETYLLINELLNSPNVPVLVKRS